MPVKLNLLPSSSRTLGPHSSQSILRARQPQTIKWPLHSWQALPKTTRVTDPSQKGRQIKTDAMPQAQNFESRHETMLASALCLKKNSIIKWQLFFFYHYFWQWHNAQSIKQSQSITKVEQSPCSSKPQEQSLKSFGSAPIWQADKQIIVSHWPMLGKQGTCTLRLGCLSCNLPKQMEKESCQGLENTLSLLNNRTHSLIPQYLISGTSCLKHLK